MSSCSEDAVNNNLLQLLLDYAPARNQNCSDFKTIFSHRNRYLICWGVNNNFFWDGWVILRMNGPFLGVFCSTFWVRIQNVKCTQNKFVCFKWHSFTSNFYSSVICFILDANVYCNKSFKMSWISWIFDICSIQSWRICFVLTVRLDN